MEDDSLDLQQLPQRLNHLPPALAGEMRSLIEQVQEQLTKADMRGPLQARHSLSIRGEADRRAARSLFQRFRQLPQEQQLPELLNGLGKLQMGAGEFDQAEKTFAEAARLAKGSGGKAEALYNAHLAALERQQWEAALAALCAAARLDPARYEPFPQARYEPRRILGSGGFGTAILCHDRHCGQDVVVKVLHAADLDRDPRELFREAHVLRQLSHPALIGGRECGFADERSQARPYLVMDYFEGETLAAHVARHGELSLDDFLAVARQVAAGMKAAHDQGVLHRDLKPDNVLLRRDGAGWQVKVIDFGLALRQSVTAASLSQGSGGESLLGRWVVGTIQYAPPEQLGRLRGVPVGRYSDVYAFGKTCCFALFQTTEPKLRHLQRLPDELVALLEGCTEEVPATEGRPGRYADFSPVLAVLESLGGAAQRRREEERDANFKRLAASGRLEAWVERHAGWDHAAWLGLLDELRRDGFWPVDEATLGAHLEALKRQRQEGRWVEVTVPGQWSSQPASEPSPTWAAAGTTPGRVPLRAGEVYQLKVDYQAATDAALAGLTVLRGEAAFHSLVVESCDRVTEAGVKHIGSLTSLRSLVLQGRNSVTNAGLAHLRGLTCLRSLDLRGLTPNEEGDDTGRRNPTTDAGLAHLHGLRDLETLNLSDLESVTDAGMAALLAALPRLQCLFLMNFRNLGDRALAPLKNVSALRSLSLYGCRGMSGAVLNHLTGRTGLTHLSISQTEGLGDSHLAVLQSLTGLVTLSFMRCTRLTDSGFRHLRGLRDLSHLMLDGCTGVTDAVLYNLRGLNQLRMLNLSDLPALTGAGLADMRGLPLLQYLSFYNSPRVGDVAFSHLKGLPALESLSLLGEQVTDAGLSHLRECPSLKSLTMYNAARITDAGLAHLTSLPNLSSLTLSKAGRITDAGLKHLERAPALASVSLSGCVGVTAAGEAALKAARPSTRVYVNRR